MWHHDHGDNQDILFAKQLIYALGQTGMKVFPNSKTNFYFDDKVGQKYLLEALGIPIVPSYVFYSKSEALNWIDKTSFPKVFKLRGGAGAANVKLVKNRSHAYRIVNNAFGKGFEQFDRIGYFKERFNKYTDGRDSLLGVIKGFGRLFITTKFAKNTYPEKGYAYFQDFIPNNEFDIRVIVIDEKAFAIKRNNRKNDFRASGSGNIQYERIHFPIDLINLSFEIAEKLQSQCAALDFIYDNKITPLLVEVSFGFSQQGYENCEGYWDKSLNFHEGKFNPQEWMVDTLLKD
jgi:glutathione synthase/RimK-type ligase-like ATP-grasp enzyme